MTVVIVAGTHFFAERKAHALGVPHPINKHVVVITPNLIPRGLLGTEVTDIHAGEGAGDVQLAILREIRSHCGPAGWPGPMPEPTWPEPKEQPE